MFGHRLTLFEIFGFKVRIDASWLLLAGLIIWSLAVGYFPMAAPGYETATYWWMGLVGLIGLALSIVIHELSHSLVARRYDMPITGITLFIFGGIAEMEEEPTGAKAEFLMAAAGPAMSLVVAAFCYGLAMGALAMGAELVNPAIVVLGYLTLINMLVAAFNLLPAFPLDGGRMLRAALWGWKKDVVWATRIAAGAGTVLGLALMALGVWSLISGAILAGVWWILIGLFVRAAAAQSYQTQVARQVLSRHPVERFMHPDPVSVPPDIPVARLVDEYFYRDFHKSYPVVEPGGRLVGAVTLDAVKRLPKAEWSSRRVAEIMQTGDTSIDAGADAGHALRRMRAQGQSRLMVVRQGERLVGVLSLKDLMNFLTLTTDLEGSPDTAARTEREIHSRGSSKIHFR